MQTAEYSRGFEDCLNSFSNAVTMASRKQSIDALNHVIDHVWAMRHQVRSAQGLITQGLKQF